MLKKFKKIFVYMLFSTSILASTNLSGTKKEIRDDYVSAFDVSKYFIKKASYNANLEITPKISENMFDRLIKSLDPSKMFFTEDDLEPYLQVRSIYGELKTEYALYFGDKIIDLYFQKLKSKYDYAINLVEKYDFNFNTKQVYDLDREEDEFEKNEKALNKLWEKRVLNDVIRLKLNGNSKKKIQDILVKRYKASRNNVLKLSDEEKKQIIINSYTEEFDPHNSWIGPDLSKDFEIANSLSLIGMGVSIQQRGEGSFITNIIKGSPADKSKAFFPGDQFIYVGQGDDGELVDVSTYRVRDLTKLIRGEVGSVVRIGVRRDEDSPIRIIRLVRDRIKQEDEEISTKTIKIGNKKVGYIEIPGFYSKDAVSNEGKDASEDLKNAINKFNKENAQSLVIDLRHNGGGSLAEVIKMVGYFIGDKVVVQVKDANNNIKRYKADTNVIWNKPVVVMINRGSASASEIFAGAIKDYNRGVIVGSNSWGKGSVQSVRPLLFPGDDGTYNLGLFKYTIQMFFRPDGASTQIKGVSPDIEFPTNKIVQETGEFKYKNALKWEKIPSAIESKYNLGLSVAKLKKLHENRIKNSKKWKLLVEETEFASKHFNPKEITLNITERKKEREFKKNKQEYFKKRSKELGIPDATVFSLDNGLRANEESIKDQLKREEELKKYIDAETYEAAEISLDLVK
ncbi:carboxy terminal-processing peptidase [Oceanivirga salmonicida]|uniref:carboxy terminal-processing peptidase n=1 Tax=Oceanivirga salmonicida TaxID=1769291 RepID=UPI0008337046|nr:carboxy terminal-processing peptidase [Oceanivirga salmonicida]